MEIVKGEVFKLFHYISYTYTHKQHTQTNNSEYGRQVYLPQLK